MFLFQAVGVDPMWAYLIIAAVAVTLAVIARRKYQKAWECGPGCICGGENVRARQSVGAAYGQQQSAPLVIQAPQPIYQQQPTPQIIVLQAPPQIIPQQQAPQVVYVQAPQPQYAPAPQPQVVMIPAQTTPQYQPREIYQQPAQLASYYPGPEPIAAEYAPEIRYLPPAQLVGQFPPASASTIEEARRRWVEHEQPGRRR
jgi:hypothetical protein